MLELEDLIRKIKEIKIAINHRDFQITKSISNIRVAVDCLARNIERELYINYGEIFEYDFVCIHFDDNLIDKLQKDGFRWFNSKIDSKCDVLIVYPQSKVIDWIPLYGASQSHVIYTYKESINNLA